MLNCKSTPSIEILTGSSSHFKLFTNTKKKIVKKRISTSTFQRKTDAPLCRITQMSWLSSNFTSFGYYLLSCWLLLLLLLMLFLNAESFAAAIFQLRSVLFLLDVLAQGCYPSCCSWRRWRLQLSFTHFLLSLFVERFYSYTWPLAAILSFWPAFFAYFKANCSQQQQ